MLAMDGLDVDLAGRAAGELPVYHPTSLLEV